MLKKLICLQAMWSDEVLLVELVKSDRGLGFSILDYQVKEVPVFLCATHFIFEHASDSSG
jgi:hypothetical protein